MCFIESLPVRILTGGDNIFLPRQMPIRLPEPTAAAAIPGRKDFADEKARSLP